MSLYLTYQINNQEPQKISIDNYTKKTIFDFFRIYHQLSDETFFKINENIIKKQTKIGTVLKENPNSLIQIYTPQTFKYRKSTKDIQFTENIKINDLKQKLKKRFNINDDQPIKIIVENHDDLDHFFNNGSRSFYKYIKPDLTFKIIIDKASQNNDEYNYNNSASSYEIKKSEKETFEKDKKSSIHQEKDNKSQKHTKSTDKKIVESKPYDNITKSRLKTKYSVKYQVNNGDIKSIFFTDEQANTIYDIFANKFPQFKESDLIFTSVEVNNQFFMLNSQNSVKDTFPLYSNLVIFTPITVSFKEQKILMPIHFKSTINEIKEAIKERFDIHKRKSIILSIREHPELNEAFNKGQKHLIKLIQPDLIFDIIVDEFRFILIDDVHDYVDNNKSKSLVNLNTTAEQFINNFLAKNEIQRQDGYIFCLLLDSERYILPNSVLSEFKSEVKEDELPQIRIIRQSINPIIINNFLYNYSFDFLENKSRITVEESKKIIYENYFFYNKSINFEDINFYIPSEKEYADNKSKMHLYHRKKLELQIGYHFENRRNQIFNFSLDKTVKEARELHNWTHLKIFENQRKIKDSLNLFASCYGIKISALKLVKLYFDVNNYQTHISLAENTKFEEIKEMIKEDSNLIERLNSNPKDKKEKKEGDKKSLSKDFIMMFGSKDLPDDLIIKNIKSSKENPIKVILRPIYKVLLKSMDGKQYKEKFSHGTQISKIRSFLFEKFHRRYKILANMIVLNDDDLIQDYYQCKPLLIRIARPLYYFMINNKRHSLELSEFTTAIQAKISLMFKFLPNVTNHHLFDLRDDDKKYNDYDVLPSYTEIEVDLAPMKSIFIFVLPDLNKLYFKLTNEGEISNNNNNNNNNNNDDNDGGDGESSKIIKIPFSTTFYDVKKSIQTMKQKREFDVKFFYTKKRIREKQKISEIEFNGTPREIEVKFVMRKIFFVLKEEENENENQNQNKVSEDEKRKEFEVYLDDEINDYKKKLLNEKVTDIERITIKTKDGTVIENERFEDFEYDFEFFYEVKPDRLFNLFDQEFDQYNDLFYTEAKIKDVRKTIEIEYGNDNVNVILETENRILNNDLHLYEIKGEKVTVKLNKKEVDKFTINMANYSPFKKLQPNEFTRKFSFTSDSTIGDLRAVLEDVLTTDNFSIVFNKKFMLDDDERLFTLGNKFDVVSGKRNGRDIFQFVLFETRKDKNIVVELNLNKTLKEALKVLNDEKVILNLCRKKDVKVIYRGRLIRDDEILYDVLMPRHKYHHKDRIFDDDDDNRAMSPCNQAPIFISYLQKRKI